eukprot:CFRG1960T1
MSLMNVLGRAGDSRKVNGELFAFMYGSLVTQLVIDYETDEAINTQLEKMGYNIGIRLIEDFLARSGVARCVDFRETADVVAKLGFKQFLGIQPAVTNWSNDGKDFSLIFDNNPLCDFVELPADHPNLSYSNLLCGVIRGALEMVQMKVECKFVQDVLQGHTTTEMRVRLLEIIDEGELPSNNT